MNNLIRSINEELDAMLSGHFIPYHKAAIMVAAVVALLFSLILQHGSVFNGRIAVIDLDGSYTSAEMIRKINTSSYIEITEVINHPVNPELLTSHDNNLGVLYIPQGFEKSLLKGDKSFSIGYFADYSNEAQNAKTIQNLHEFIPQSGAEISIAKLSKLDLEGQNIEAILSPMQLKTRNLFNPTSSTTLSTGISFVYFFSSLTYGLTVLMIIGRLKVTGLWDKVVFQRGPFALLVRIVPYSFFYTTAITLITALLVFFKQLRFDGNYFAYVPSLFMTGLAIGWLAFILSWTTKNPGEGAGRMVFLIPPGFIMGGATMAVGILPFWAYYASYCFPLVWQYRFYRDFAMRGEQFFSMLSTYGGYLMFLTCIAAAVTLIYYRSEKRFYQEMAQLEEI